MVNYIRKS